MNRVFEIILTYIFLFDVIISRIVNNYIEINTNYLSNILYSGIIKIYFAVLNINNFSTMYYIYGQQ